MGCRNNFHDCQHTYYSLLTFAPLKQDQVRLPRNRTTHGSIAC